MFPAAPGCRVALATLAAGALLVCHGLFGASHVIGHGGTGGSTPVTHAAKHAATPEGFGGLHHAPGSAGSVGHHEPSGPPVGTAEYLAVLFALVGATLLAVFPGHVRVGPVPAWRILSALRVSEIQPSLKGPSPPLLQVFRL